MQAISKIVNQTRAVSSEPPPIPAGTNDENVKRFLEANTNKIATTVRIKFPSWYSKHYGKTSEEELYKRMLSAMIETELVKTYTALGCSLRDIELMINEGLTRLSHESKTPPHHQEIIELCTRIDGVPLFEQAWYEALKGISRRSHAVVTAAVNAVGVSDFKGADQDNQILKMRFKAQYLIKTRLFKAGKDLNQHVKVLDSDSREKTPAEVAELSWQLHEKAVLERVAKQNISTNSADARKQALAALGLKDRKVARV